MTRGHAAQKQDLMTNYREEGVRGALIITAVILLIIALPLGLWIVKVNKEGIAAADVTRFNALVKLVDTDVQSVGAMLRNDTEALDAMKASRKKPVITLVVPEILIVENERNNSSGPNPLTVELEGIYWSPRNPLVGIDGETYKIGDVIDGYEIVRITKTGVQFQSEDGNIVVRDMYENLLEKSMR